MGVMIHQSRCYLFIISFANKTFAMINPSVTRAVSAQNFFEKFLNFIKLHNLAHTNSQIETDGWILKNYSHPINEEQSEKDSAVFILKYIRDLIDTNTIDKKSFDVCGYRDYLAHYILQNSKSMKNRCVVCGYSQVQGDLLEKSIDSTPKASSSGLIDWTRCNICKRWCHDDCTIIDKNKKIFLCVMCK